MTLEHVTFAMTALVLLGNLVWYLSAWRTRTDRTEDVVPQLEQRLREVEAQHADYALLQRTVEEIKARLEVVATRSHETINRMNALPEVLSALFLRKDVADVVIRESSEDRGRLHRKVDELAQVLSRSNVQFRQKERS